MNKTYAFFFHYNKPMSKSSGKNILSIHYRGKCLFVEDIDCRVNIKTKTNKEQPKCVLHGYGIVTVKNQKAIITGANNAESSKVLKSV